MGKKAQCAVLKNCAYKWVVVIGDLFFNQKTTFGAVAKRSEQKNFFRPTLVYMFSQSYVKFTLDQPMQVRIQSRH